MNTSSALIRQIALECGYSSASLRERLYVGTAAAPAAGLLLSTAASDSEGTLGGLVALGRAEHLKRLLDQALRDAMRCSPGAIREHLLDLLARGVLQIVPGVAVQSPRRCLQAEASIPRPADVGGGQ